MDLISGLRQQAAELKKQKEEAEAKDAATPEPVVGDEQTPQAAPETTEGE